MFVHTKIGTTMTKNLNITATAALVACVWAVMLLALPGCDEDETDRWAAGPDGDAGSDDDDDSNGDTAGCVPVEWGSGAVKGQPVGNWQLSGFSDGDGDHIVEQLATTVTLEDIHCTGKKSLIVSIGDST